MNKGNISVKSVFDVRIGVRQIWALSVLRGERLCDAGFVFLPQNLYKLFQAIHRPFRRVLRQQTCSYDRINKRKTFIALVVFCDPASRTRLLYETPPSKY